MKTISFQAAPLPRTRTTRKLWASSLVLVACAANAPVPAPQATNLSSATFEATFEASPEGKALAARLTAFAKSRGHRAGMPTTLTFTPDDAKLLYLRTRSATDDTQVLFELDLATGQPTELASPDSLLATPEGTLTPEERARRERLRIQARGIVSYELSQDGKLVLLPLASRMFLLDRETKKVREIAVSPGTFDPHLSPSGEHVGYVRNNNVYVANIGEGKNPDERAITKGGTADVTMGLAEFVAQEELDRTRGYWFSPDGSEVLYEEADLRAVEKLSIPDLARPERPADEPRYPRAGHANAKVRFWIAPMSGASAPRAVPLPERYEYVAQVSWQKGHPPMFTLLEREQKKLAIWTDGAAKALATRDDPAFIDVDAKTPTWLSEGTLAWNSDHEQLSSLTLPRASVRMHPPGIRYERYIGSSNDGSRTFFLGGARPTASQLVGVSAGAAFYQSSATENVLDAVVDHRGKRAAVMESSLSHWPSWKVVDLEKGASLPIPHVARFPEELPRAELTTLHATDASGERLFHAVIVHPRNQPAGKKLAVLDAAYGGPHVNYAVEHALSYVRAQWLADATGALVVSVDGRGTPRRGKAWEQAISGHLASVPLDDHAAAMQALSRVPDADPTRVGIFGWSFGGYLSALAATRRPDVFRAAMVGAPVIDFRDYDTCYTERYLGIPDARKPSYDEASVLFGLEKRGPSAPMLLFHGTADDNVYFAHTLKLSDALFRARRPYKLVPLSGMTHGISDPALTVRVWNETAAFFRVELGTRP